MSEFASLSSFTDLDSFSTDWVNDGYSPNGGDGPELQLDSLCLGAQDMIAYSTPGNPNTYIVEITDSIFHDDEGGSTVTEPQTISDLTSSNCKVYISLWDEGWGEPWPRFMPALM